MSCGNYCDTSCFAACMGTDYIPNQFSGVSNIKEGDIHNIIEPVEKQLISKEKYPISEYLKEKYNNNK